MITDKEPDKKKWKILSEQQVNNMFVRAEASMGYTPANYLFFLTEATEDYLVWEGEVYAKRDKT